MAANCGQFDEQAVRKKCRLIKIVVNAVSGAVLAADESPWPYRPNAASGKC